MTQRSTIETSSKCTAVPEGICASHESAERGTPRATTVCGWMAALLTASALVACGGGGTGTNANGGGTTDPVTPTDPQQAAAQRYRLVPPIALVNIPGLLYVLFKSPINASGYNTNAGQWVAAQRGTNPNYCLNQQGEWINVDSLLDKLSYISATDTRWVVDKEACGDAAVAHTAQVQDISGQKLQTLYPNWATALGADAAAVFPQGSSTLINWTSVYPSDTLIADTSSSHAAFGVGMQGLIDHYATQSGNAMTDGLSTYKLQFTSGSNGTGTVTLTSLSGAATFNAQYTITTLRGQQYIKITGWPTAADMKQKDPDGSLGILEPSFLSAGQYPAVVLVNGAARWATFSPGNTPVLDAINGAVMPLAMNKVAFDAALQVGHLPAFTH